MTRAAIRWRSTAQLWRPPVFVCGSRRKLAQYFVKISVCGTQPYDLPRREIIADGPMFGTPVYRWLPAKSKIESHFLLFYARVRRDFSTWTT